MIDEKNRKTVLRESFCLGYDASVLQGKKSGVEYYALRLYEALRECLGQDKIIAFSNMQVPEILDAVVLPSRLPLFLWRQVILPQAVKRTNVTSFHSPVTAVPFGLNCPVMATVHDLCYRSVSSGDSWKYRMIQRANCCLAMHVCSKVIAVSQTTANKLQEIYPKYMDKITTILSGALANPPEEDGGELNYTGLAKPYVVQLGRIDSRKNPLLTAQAFKESGLFHTYSLVFVGSAGNASSKLSSWLSQNPQVANKIILTEYQPQQSVHNLLCNAEALVYPSDDEGFGHPPFEALSVGVLPIVSDIPVLRELLKEGALYISRNDAHSLANIFKMMMKNTIDKKSILCAGKETVRSLTWHSTAEKLLTFHCQRYGSTK